MFADREDRKSHDVAPLIEREASKDKQIGSPLRMRQVRAVGGLVDTRPVEAFRRMEHQEELRSATFGG